MSTQTTRSYTQIGSHQFVQGSNIPTFPIGFNAPGYTLGQHNTNVGNTNRGSPTTISNGEFVVMQRIHIGSKGSNLTETVVQEVRMPPTAQIAQIFACHDDRSTSHLVDNGSRGQQQQMPNFVASAPLPFLHHSHSAQFDTHKSQSGESTRQSRNIVQFSEPEQSPSLTYHSSSAPAITRAKQATGSTTTNGQMSSVLSSQRQIEPIRRSPLSLVPEEGQEHSMTHSNPHHKSLSHHSQSDHNAGSVVRSLNHSQGHEQAPVQLQGLQPTISAQNHPSPSGSFQSSVKQGSYKSNNTVPVLNQFQNEQIQFDRLSQQCQIFLESLGYRSSNAQPWQWIQQLTRLGQRELASLSPNLYQRMSEERNTQILTHLYTEIQRDEVQALLRARSNMSVELAPSLHTSQRAKGQENAQGNAQSAHTPVQNTGNVVETHPQHSVEESRAHSPSPQIVNRLSMLQPVMHMSSAPDPVEKVEQGTRNDNQVIHSATLPQHDELAHTGSSQALLDRGQRNASLMSRKQNFVMSTKSEQAQATSQCLFLETQPIDPTPLPAENNHVPQTLIHEPLGLDWAEQAHDFLQSNNDYSFVSHKGRTQKVSKGASPLFPLAYGPEIDNFVQNDCHTAQNTVLDQDSPPNNHTSQAQQQRATTLTPRASRMNQDNSRNDNVNKMSVVPTTWVTPEEYDQRQGKGACTYCEKIGHFAQHCPQQHEHVSGQAAFIETSRKIPDNIIIEVKDEIWDIDGTLLGRNAKGDG